MRSSRIVPYVQEQPRPLIGTFIGVLGAFATVVAAAIAGYSYGQASIRAELTPSLIEFERLKGQERLSATRLDSMTTALRVADSSRSWPILIADSSLRELEGVSLLNGEMIILCLSIEIERRTFPSVHARLIATFSNQWRKQNPERESGINLDFSSTNGDLSDEFEYDGRNYTIALVAAGSGADDERIRIAVYRQ